MCVFEKKQGEVIFIINMADMKTDASNTLERDWAQPTKGESGGLKERKLRRGTILAALPSSNRANGGT